MLEIRMMPVWTYIDGDQIPVNKLRAALRYFVKSSVHSPMFKEGKWDGYKYLFFSNTRYTRFPTGLWYKVKEILDAEEIQYKTKTGFMWPLKAYEWKLRDGITPYEDQKLAIEAALKYKRGIIEYPTGLGKTAVISGGIIAEFGVRSLFVVHQDSLLYQAKREIETNVVSAGGTPLEVGVIGDGEVDIKPITVATIQTLYSRIRDAEIKKALNDYFKLVIIDECQNIGTKMWRAVMDECNAPYRFPISATAHRQDGGTLEIHAVGGRVIAKMTAGDAIEKGYLSDVRIEFVPFDHGLYNETDRTLLYAPAYKSYIVENYARNTLVIDKAIELLDEGRYIIVLVVRIEHGEIIKEMFATRGVSDVEFIWGQTGKGIREEAIQDFKDGKFRVLIGSAIFDVGIDIPRASGLVCAGAGSSSIRVPQRVGRVIRRFGKGKLARVIDIQDLHVKFFTKQYKYRKQIYEEEIGADKIVEIEEKKPPRQKSEWEMMFPGLQGVDEALKMFKK